MDCGANSTTCTQMCRNVRRARRRLSELPGGADAAPIHVASKMARQLAQLFTRVDDLGRAGEARGLDAVMESPPRARPGHYERRWRMATTTLGLCLSVVQWATLRETPFWLLTYETAGRPARGVAARLALLAAEVPPRVARDAETGCSVVPLFAPTGADGDTVLAEPVGQVAEVACLLGEGPISGFGSPT